MRKQWWQRGEIGVLLRIAKKRIERAFDGGQVDLNFLADLEHQHAFLRALGHVVHQRVRATGDGRQRRAGHRGLEARDNIACLRRKFRRQTEIIFQGRLEEQERGGDLQRLGFTGRPLNPAKVRADRAQRLNQLGDILVGLLLGGLEKLLGLGRVGFKCGAVAAGELEPVVFLRLHLFAQRPHRAFQLVVRLRFADGLRQCEQFVELIEVTNFSQALGLRLGFADYQQNVAEQFLRHFLKAVDQQLNLLIDLAEQLHGKRTGLAGIGGNRVEESTGCIPERTRRRCHLQGFDGERRVAHVARAADHVLVAEQLQ